MPTEVSRTSGALSGDGQGHLVRSPVRKQRLPKSKERLAKEAAKVLNQVDKIECVSEDRGVLPEKFYTLPSRRKNKTTTDDENHRRKSEELGVTTETPPKKPPRTFTHSTPKSNKSSIFNFFTNKRNQTKKSNLKRSVSDASHLKVNSIANTRNAESDNEDLEPIKKQLTPIIETAQHDDYFSSNSNKENLDENINRNRDSVTEKLKEYIDEIDSALFNESEPIGHPIKNRRKVPEVFIIDVDQAEKIEGPNKLGKRIKSLVKNKKPNKPQETSVVKEAVENLQGSAKKSTSQEMVHSSQKPAEKIPLTRGLTVDTMVKRLSNDKISPPPPKTNILVSPSISVQHNNNQPFSYTRGQSPERLSPVIYAHVICDKPLNGSTIKQTVHAAYTNGKKHIPHSDSDEGLGNEENSGCGREKTVTRFGDDVEDPITPKFQYNSGYTSKTEHTIFIDSSSRGRGDGMDSKRRESLTEPHENGFIHDLSTRRDLLESRINSRYYKPVGASTKYISETSSKYYRQGSASPVGFTERHEREIRTDSHGQRHHTSKYDYKHHNGNNVKQQLFKDREHYKSNPEIVQRGYESKRYNGESYHESLKRETYNKDKLGDSGIENDFNREGSRNDYRRYDKEPEYYNESEDEGFASSLLIASERQHTEENVNNRKTRRDYDSDRSYRERDDPYKNTENIHHKVSKTYRSKEYAPRERSIDDGSHYDPRIDKDGEFSTLKKLEKKPPKPEKKSGLDKVKQLFTRDSNKKKKEKDRMVPEESLRARYVEYKSSRENLHEPRAVQKNAHEVKSSYNYSNQRSLTPSPSSTREVYQNGKSEKTSSSWFKSLDRLSHKKSNKNLKDVASEDDLPTKRTPTKSLRFFGDTDAESNDSVRQKPSTKTRSSLALNGNYYNRNRSQSEKDLHNTSDERRTSPYNGQKSPHNVTDSEREAKSSRLSTKPPISPNHQHRSTNSREVVRGRRRRNEVSSVESSTEGDSSQQSQRSVVYLHAATVGDIPGPGYLRNAKSREELASNTSSNIRPQVKTLSRSFSVLAPWKPKHIKESYDIDYTDYSKPNGTKNGKYEQKVNKTNGYIKKESTSTLKKKATETRRSNQNLSTLNRSKTRSKESLNKSKDGSNSTLYKKKERQPKENTRYSNNEKRISSKTMSVESLGNGVVRKDGSRGDVSRSVSMPRDPQKSAGWFNINKKSKKSSSTQRL